MSLEPGNMGLDNRKVPTQNSSWTHKKRLEDSLAPLCSLISFQVNSTLRPLLLPPSQEFLTSEFSTTPRAAQALVSHCAEQGPVTVLSLRGEELSWCNSDTLLSC